MSRGRLALVLAATAVALCMPGTASAELRVSGRIAGRRIRVRVPSRLLEAVEGDGGFAGAAALPWRLR